MTRRRYLLACAALTGCETTPAALLTRERVPARVGDFRLVEADAVPPSLWPPLAQQLKARQAFRATYQGPERLRVVLYELPTPTSAFEMVQKWSAAPRTSILYEGPLVAVVEPEEGGGQQMVPFQEGLRTALSRVGK